MLAARPTVEKLEHNVLLLQYLKEYMPEEVFRQSAASL